MKIKNLNTHKFLFGDSNIKIFFLNLFFIKIHKILSIVLIVI